VKWIFGVALLGILSLAGFIFLDNQVDIPVPVVQAVVADPYDEPLLSSYKLYRDAVMVNDWITLENLSMLRDDYVAYRSALTLVQQDLPATQKVGYYRRLLELRPESPLAKQEKSNLLLGYAQSAEAAGYSDEAIRIYQEALPKAEAIEGLKRLQTDPYQLANIFLQSRLYQASLDALAGNTAPSIEAPAYAGLGKHQQALEAYERWLLEDPNSQSALLGKAWQHFYLGDHDSADSLFSQFSGSEVLLGRALIARARDDIDAAVSYLQQSGNPDHLWLASGYLEARDRYQEVLPIYLQLAQGTSKLSDDAAYRAYILATRLGDSQTAETAKSYLPQNSFFALKTGQSLNLTLTSQINPVTLETLERAQLLNRIQDTDGAIGELLFALKRATEPSDIVTIAEQLQQMGEYYQSWRAVTQLLDRGFTDIRLWYLSYPRAYHPEVDNEAKRLGIDPMLVWAVMRQESAFYPRAISSSNARGLLQVVPSTWDWLAELQSETPGDPFQVATNIRYGTFYLQWLTNYLQNDLELIIVSYNRGQGYIKRLYEGPVVAGNKDELYREIDTLEAREYLQSVMVNYQIYKYLYPQP
jgi:soluble lytic murein transglycosylase